MAASKLDETRFLNIDLDIYSKSDLQPLVVALGPRVINLFAGRVKRTYEAHLELNWRRDQTPSSIILRFCKVIDDLPPEKRKLWNSTKARSFDVGIESPKRNTHY